MNHNGKKSLSLPGSGLTGAGLTGVSLGTIMINLLDLIPTQYVQVKIILKQLTPVIITFVSLFYVWYYERLTQHLKNKRVRDIIDELCEFIQKKLKDEHTSPEHKKRLQETLQELDSRLIDIQLQQINHIVKS